MALRRNMRLFEIGSTIYYAHMGKDRQYTAQAAIVKDSVKGRLILKLIDTDEVVDCSPQTRELSFTQAECSYICHRLNRETFGGN